MKQYLLVLLAGIALTSCNAGENGLELDRDNYCYEIRESGDRIKEIYKTVTWSTESNYRVRDSIVDVRNGKHMIRLAEYEVGKDGYLYKTVKVNDQFITERYLSYENIGEPVDFELGVPHLNTSVKLLGDTIIRTVEGEINTRKFLKTTGEIDGVVSELLLDSNFLLMREEYKEGFSPSFIILRQPCDNFSKD